MCGVTLCSHRYPDAHSCAGTRAAARQGFLSRFTAAKPKPKPKPRTAAKKPAAKRGRGTKTNKWGQTVDPTNTLIGTAARRMRGADARAVGAATAAAAPAPAPASRAGHGREVCPTCQARFELVTDLVAHVESWHAAPAAAAAGGGGSATASAGAGSGGDSRATPCPRCGAAFYNPVDLVTHCESGQCPQTRRQSSCMVS